MIKAIPLSVLILILLVTVVGAQTDQNRPLPAAKSTAANGRRTFSERDFQNLRWLLGDWRGSEEDGKNPFYERYSFVGKDRIEMQSFKDAAMTQRGEEKSVTFLKNGSIYHQAGQAVWVADRLNKREISFVPEENAQISFSWKMESPDIWTATIRFADGDGRRVEKVYRLERIKR